MSTGRNRSNARVGIALACLAGGMVGLSFAAVPLYRWFCQVTGFGGTTMRAERAPEAPGERVITVRFNADVAGNDLPWRFQPLERQVTLRVGEERLAFYRATNVGQAPVVGTATYNVTPHKAAPYFHKLACFCRPAEQPVLPGSASRLCQHRQLQRRCSGTSRGHALRVWCRVWCKTIGGSGY